MPTPRPPPTSGTPPPGRAETGPVSGGLLLGLFERPFTDRTHLSEVGSARHRALARRAAARSQVLLKNKGKVLPLSGSERIYVAGGNADDIVVVGETPYAEGFGDVGDRPYDPLFPYGWGLRTKG